MKKDWEIKKLYEICEIECGTRVVRKVDGGTIFPVYGGGGATFKMDTYNRENCLIVSRFAMSEKCTRFVEGKFFLNDSGLSLRANENVIYQKYLETVILGKNDEIYSLGRGAAQKNLDMARFRELEISYPKSLEEQKRIVKILDEKFAQLETIKTNAQTNLQNAKDLFQSQLAKAFSNTTWEKKRLQDCTSIIGDGLHGTPKYDENGNYYFINGSNLTITDIVFTPETKRVNETEYQKYKVELNENTVFLSINGSTLGKRTAFYNNEPVILGKSACYINVKSNTLNKYFLRHFLSSDIFQEYAWKEKTGAAIPNLGLKAMRDLKIPLPPLPEQKRIVKELDTLSEKVRQLQEIYTKQIANCDELKQSLLQKAFKGEL